MWLRSFHLPTLLWEILEQPFNTRKVSVELIVVSYRLACYHVVLTTSQNLKPMKCALFAEGRFYVSRVCLLYVSAILVHYHGALGGHLFVFVYLYVWGLLLYALLYLLRNAHT
jgi:hypothetical protein